MDEKGKEPLTWQELRKCLRCRKQTQQRMTLDEEILLIECPVCRGIWAANRPKSGG